MPRGPVILWREAIRDSETLSANARYVALLLSIYMRSDGTNAFPSIDTLASRTRRCRRTIVDALDELERTGYLSIVHGGGRGRPNRYTARLPQTAERVQTVSETVQPLHVNSASQVRKRCSHVTGNKTSNKTKNETNNERTTEVQENMMCDCDGPIIDFETGHCEMCGRPVDESTLRLERTLADFEEAA